MTKAVAEKVEASGYQYGQSHQNDPFGCAVVKSVLSTIRNDNLIQHASKIGKTMGESLSKLASKHACIKEIRGIGLMYVMEFQTQNGFSLEKIHKKLFDSGFIAGISSGANLLRFYPPLIITTQMLDGLIDSLDEILTKSYNVNCYTGEA